MRDYYGTKLAGERLRMCYEVAPARVRQYLEAEIAFVQRRLQPDSQVLELGCGYGRVAMRLAAAGVHVVGIDTSAESLALARKLSSDGSRCDFLRMDASALAFRAGIFDTVVCIQNGICAFGVDQETLAREAIRVLRPGGRAIFSTYAAEFWSERLRWFEVQVTSGLMGEIDYELTGMGTIVTKDGFRAGTLSPEALERLGSRLRTEVVITTVDESSVFCELVLAGPSSRPDRADGCR